MANETSFDMLLNEKLHGVNTAINEEKLFAECGRVSNITGLSIEVVGISLAIGQVCRIYLEANYHVDAEVVGFTEHSIMVMPYDHTVGIAKGMVVAKQSASGCALVGEKLLGRVVDALGNPIDDKGDIEFSRTYPLYPKPMNPLKRTRISHSLDVGVRAINALMTIGKGQRMGIFAESGIGKSVLLGMMTKFTQADVVVVGLIGERGREVKEFIEEIMGEEGLQKSVVVASPANSSPIIKVLGATYATSIAEYFRDQGKDVLLIVDSLTRYAQSYREIALAGGEMPTSKGYTPTVFARLSQLMERSGNGITEQGSITAFYTVLIEGEELSDPVAEHVRSLVDGHIILTRQLAESGHFPAIDIEKSISRLMHYVTPKEQQQSALMLKKIANAYQNSRDMISIGMYQFGSDKMVDCGVKFWPDIQKFLTQGMDEKASMQESLTSLNDLLTHVRPSL